jgi:predicted dithiol-disulfide oxidoreductase (DUF899 family)
MAYYGVLDRTPMGRHEEGEQTHGLRRHDEYKWVSAGRRTGGAM